MAVYDDQKSDEDVDKDFHDLIGHNFKPGEADQIEAKAQDEHNQAVNKELEDMTAAEQAAQDESEEKVADKDSLAEQESGGSGAAGGDGDEDSNDEPDDNDDAGPKKRGIKGWSKRKKWAVGLSAGLVGGGGIAGIIGLMVLSPLSRVEMLINRGDGFYGAVNNQAVDNGVENEINTYMTRKVFPNLGKGTCHSTVDASCLAASSNSSNPIGRMFNAWKENRMENKLATQYGLVFGKQGSTYYMNLDGKNINLRDGTNIFNAANTNEAKAEDIRAAVRDRFKEASLYDRVYTKWKVGKFLENKYGVKRCVTEQGCKFLDKINNSITDKKNAFKAYFIRRVITPYSENLAVALQCVLTGSCDLDPSPNHDQIDENGAQRQSGLQATIQSQIDALAEKYGKDALKDLAAQVSTIGREGIARYAFRAVLSKIIGRDITSEALDKVMTPIGWINLAAQIITFIDNVGPTVKKLTFAVNSVAAVQTYMFYESADHEARAGHTDLTEFGTISDALTTGSVDDNGKSSDMTQTPMYQEVVNGNSVPLASAKPSLFDTTAFAADTSHVYTCNDGHPVPSGQRVCPEERLNAGNDATTAISDAANSIPGWDALVVLAKAWQHTIGFVSNLISSIASKLINGLPYVQQLMDQVANWLTPLLTWFAKLVFPNPLASLTGGRVGDMVLAGADVSYNMSASAQLGGARITDDQAAAARTAYLEDQKQEFQKKPLYARIFDTNSTYSLVTQMAAAMPTKSMVASSVANILHDPFGHFSSAVLGVFSPTNHAFAAVQPHPDPFGMPQIGILPSQIPTDVDDAWWDKNCPQDYQQKFLDSQTEDPDTGIMIASKPDPCMLYNTVAQAGGGMFDPTMLPGGGQ